MPELSTELKKLITSMLDLDENSSPSFTDVANHPWMQGGSGDWEQQLESAKEVIKDRMGIINHNRLANEEGVARRGVGGADKRASLNTDEIDDEINKDSGTRNMVKVEDYDFRINKINQFKSTNSPYKIFMEFILLFKADTLERKETD